MDGAVSPKGLGMWGGGSGGTRTMGLDEVQGCGDVCAPWDWGSQVMCGM